MSNRGALANITTDLLGPLWRDGSMSTDAIGARLGVTGAAIRYHAKHVLKLPPRGPRSRQKMGDAEFTRLWMSGVSTADIAKAGGYAHRSCISTRRKLLGLPPRTRSKGGKRHAGWVETITLTEYREAELARLMQGAA